MLLSTEEVSNVNSGKAGDSFRHPSAKRKNTSVGGTNLFPDKDEELHAAL